MQRCLHAQSLGRVWPHRACPDLPRRRGAAGRTWLHDLVLQLCRCCELASSPRGRQAAMLDASPHNPARPGYGTQAHAGVPAPWRVDLDAVSSLARAGDPLCAPSCRKSRNAILFIGSTVARCRRAALVAAALACDPQTLRLSVLDFLSGTMSATAVRGPSGLRSCP